MTPGPLAQFRTVSFGDPEGLVWGGALESAGAAAVVFAAGGASGAVAGANAVRWSAHEDGWRLSGDSLELFLAPQGDPEAGPAEVEPPEPELVVDQLCRVTGTLSTGGAEHPVDGIGIASFIDEIDPGRIGSVRGVSGWFGGDAALTLLALRPPGGRGHEDDVVVATLFESERRLAAEEARLSTTYDDTGAPARTSLELWIGSGDQQFPRRAAGEARQAGAEACGEAIQLRVTPLRCHADGLEGSGVYLLARL